MTPSTGGQDCAGHGTHVAGTIGGATYGIAKKVSLVSVRVLDCTGKGSFDQVIAGVNWVTANAVKPAVANMSLGGAPSTALDTAVANSIASGITYSIAAGNQGTDACTSSPAVVPTALTVGATDITDARASFSDYGSCVDLFAPGVNIVSDWFASPFTQTVSGTSMASPHVAGRRRAVPCVLPVGDGRRRDECGAGQCDERNGGRGRASGRRTSSSTAGSRRVTPAPRSWRRARRPRLRSVATMSCTSRGRSMRPARRQPH